MFVFGYCPLEGLAKDSIHWRGQKILVVLMELAMGKVYGGVCHSGESAKDGLHT